MAESSWSDDRVVYVASGDRRITAGMIEELLAAQSRSAPARPSQRRAKAREAEREAIAGRLRPDPPVARREMPAPPATSGQRPSGPDPRVAALELQVDDLEAEVAGLHVLVGRLKAALAPMADVPIPITGESIMSNVRVDWIRTARALLGR